MQYDDDDDDDDDIYHEMKWKHSGSKCVRKPT